MANEEALIDLGEAISDGATVDWTAAESRADGAEARTLVRQLKLIADIVELHRHLNTAAAPTSAEVTTTGKAEPSRTWGHLRLLEKVGHGAFGEVYRAWDTRLDREVALKLLHRPASRSGSASAVVEEGRLLARVHHANVVTVYGAERIDDRVGIWMEFIHGRTLEQLLREHGPYGAREAAIVGIDLCRALAAIHQAGLLHRDIKAHNVMRAEGGRTVLMDFGTGRESGELLIPGADLAGTPLYLAPELYRDGQATAASDLYSLGVLLYHLVTAAYPVAGRNLDEMRSALGRGSQQRLRDARPDLPQRFIEAVEAALSPDPHQRPESAGALEAMLTGVVAAAAAAVPRAPVAEAINEGDRSDERPAVRLPARPEPVERPRPARGATPPSASERGWGPASAEEGRTARSGQALRLPARPESVEERTARSGQAAAEIDVVVPPVRGWWTSRRVWVAAAAAVVVLALAAVPLLRRPPPPSASAPAAAIPAQIRSLAVLPLVNLSGDASQEYLADGITEVLTADLSKIGALRVISRTSAMRFKAAQRPVGEIAKALTVQALVQGSVARVGSRVRVAVQLIDGPRDQHLWAETYERDMGDVLGLQAEIARTIADRVSAKLRPEEAKRLAGRRAVRADAQDAYLRARHAFREYSVAGYERAVALFEEAVRVDPDYAMAHAGLSEAYRYLSHFSTKLPHQVMIDRARAAAVRSLDLEESGSALASLAQIKFLYDWDWRGAEEAFARAVEIDPNDASTRHFYALFLAARGRLDDAEDQITRARDLDPLTPLNSSSFGAILYYKRRYADAVSLYQSILREDPSFAIAHFGLAWAYSAMNRPADAVVEIERALADAPDALKLAERVRIQAQAGPRAEALRQYDDLLREAAARTWRVPKSAEAWIHAALGDRDRAFGLLARAFEERDPEVLYLKVDPRADPLRNDPRFAGFLERLGVQP